MSPSLATLPIVFHPVLGTGWLVLALLAIGTGIAWSIAKGLRSRTRGLFLATLRIIALVLLALMLAQPQQRKEEITVIRQQLAVLVDNSQSMSERVDPNQPTRSAQAAEWMKSSNIQTASKDFDVRLFAFDQTPTEAHSFADLKFNGTQTNLAGSITRLREHFRGQPLAGILLLSDGLERAEDLAGATVASGSLGEPSVPVFTFELEKAFKPKKLPKRISLANLDYPPRVVTGWDTEVRASIAAHGMSGQTLKLELWRENQKAFETSVAFNEEDQTRQVAFPITQAVSGAVHYELRINDPDTDKDSRATPFVIEAMEPGNRILYIQNTLGFDFKFLRKAILSDRNLQLSAFVRWADGRLVNIADTNSQALDLSPQALANTAVVILGDLTPEALTQTNYQALRDFVDHGGGLVLLGGPHSIATPALASPPIAPLLPVKVPAEYRDGNFPMKITDTGLHHPVFGSLFTSIEDFPPLLTFNFSPAVSPNTEVLLETVANGKSYPAVATMRYGQGRVFMVMSDTLWRWRLASKGWNSTRSPYDTFWAQLVDWLIPKEQQKQDSNRLELFSERNTYLGGQQPELRAILRTADPNVPQPSTIPLQLRTPDEKVFEYTLRAGSFTGRDGKKVAGYRVTVEPNTTGIFRAKAVANVNGLSIEGETRFVVSAPASELTGKPIDRSVLKNIAQSTGGAYYAMGQWKNWMRDLHVKEQHSAKTELIELWNHPLILALFLLLLTVEWGTRKYWNLP